MEELKKEVAKKRESVQFQPTQLALLVDSRPKEGKDVRDPIRESHFPPFASSLPPSHPLFALLPPHILFPPRCIPSDAPPAISPPMRAQDLAWYPQQPIRGGDLMWSAGHRPIGEPTSGDWPIGGEEIGGDRLLMRRGDAYLSCLGDRAAQEQASTQNLRQNIAPSKMFMNPTDFVQYLASNSPQEHFVQSP